MTLKNASDMAARLRNLDTIQMAAVERILPEALDPIKDGDNGWDVMVRVKDEWLLFHE